MEDSNLNKEIRNTCLFQLTGCASFEAMPLRGDGGREGVDSKFARL